MRGAGGCTAQLRNTGEVPLVLYTIYSPPEHEVDAVPATKADADEAAVRDEPPRT